MTARKPADPLVALVRSALKLDERVRGGNAGPLAALDALEAQAEDAEKRAQGYKLDFLAARERAEAAEAERDELRAERDRLADALRGIRDVRLDEFLEDLPSCHDARGRMRDIARAALDGTGQP